MALYNIKATIIRAHFKSIKVQTMVKADFQIQFVKTTLQISIIYIFCLPILQVKIIIVATIEGFLCTRMERFQLNFMGQARLLARLQCTLAPSSLMGVKPIIFVYPFCYLLSLVFLNISTNSNAHRDILTCIIVCFCQLVLFDKKF